MVRCPSRAPIVDDAAIAAADADGRWCRRIDSKLLLASLVIAVGLVLIGFALARSVTGDEVTDCRARSRRSPRPRRRAGAPADAGRRRPRRGLRGPADRSTTSRCRRSASTSSARSTSSRASRSTCRRAWCSSRATRTLTFTPGDEHADRAASTRARTPCRSSTGGRSRARQRPAPTPGRSRRSSPSIRVSCRPGFPAARPRRRPSGAGTLGSGSPVSRRRSKAASSRIGTPTFSALVTLLAPGLVADDEGVRLGAHAARALAAAGDDRRLGLLARVAGQRPRDDHGLAGEHLGRLRRARHGHAEVDAGGAQLLDERPVRLQREPRGDRAGDDRAEALDRRPAPPRTPRPRASSVPKCGGQRLRRGRAEVLDAERRQQPRQRPVPRPVDGGEQLVGADLGEALERRAARRAVKR